MVHQRKKDLCFWLVRPLLRVVACGIRATWPLRRTRRPLWLHLGSGDKYLPSFVNIDANPLRKIDLWLDLRNPLPFPETSVDGIYVANTLEHLYPDECGRLLRECFRVLKPGAALRIMTPHLSHAVEAYVNRNLSWFLSWPREYRSLGGRLTNFLLCDGQHRSVFDRSMLEELLGSAGFTQIHECRPGMSSWLQDATALRIEQEDRSSPSHGLYLECKRP